MVNTFCINILSRYIHWGFFVITCCVFWVKGRP